jgi:hypothetical protein
MKRLHSELMQGKVWVAVVQKPFPEAYRYGKKEENAHLTDNL